MDLHMKLWLLVACGAVAMIHCAPSGENRPYEFGFNIGTQHREEKKDENGLITGEYGFWTADNYYNVFKYATDAEGKFRILSRKRIPVPPPTPAPEPAGADGKDGGDGDGADADAAAAAPTTTTTTTTERVKIYQFEYDTKNETNPEAHGHQEMGFSDTSKMGDYYWDGPDGYRRTITYVADDDGGYRPVIKQTKTPA